MSTTQEHMANIDFSTSFLDEIKDEAKKAAEEICEIGCLDKGSILVIGCSSSEVAGEKIGTFSSPDVAKAVFEGIYSVTSGKGIHLAAQCCEHLNRAIIVDASNMQCQDIVNVVPMPKAGGSFATCAYKAFKKPAALEHIKADAGLDIGGTLIGMHLKEVAVPVRLSLKQIGNAPLSAARTRPKFIGGIRAHYDDSML